MKKVILGVLLITLFACNKEVTAPTISNNSIASTKIEYYGKTSYELKKSNNFINVDAVREKVGIRYIGRFNGNSNMGFVYIDINNDGLEDIFYPYSTGSESVIKPDVMINKGGYYVLDNSMLPTEYNGNQVTRKTLVGDYNNDSLPDLFLINHGYEDPTQNYYPGETCTLLLSDKKTNKYKLGVLPNIEKSFWHGGASGDLNGDGNLDIIVLGGKPAKVLYGDGKGNFNVVDWKYNAGYGYITAEIVDVDKDGQNDIILSGNEGRPAPALYSKSTIFFNNNTNFSKQTIICEPSVTGWGNVMGIACEDIDSDGINEIFLSRTGDINGIYYGGYSITLYKKTDNVYADVSEQFIKRSILLNSNSGYWMYQMIVKKEIDGGFTINAYITNNSTVQTWKQNKTNKIFE